MAGAHQHARAHLPASSPNRATELQAPAVNPDVSDEGPMGTMLPLIVALVPGRLPEMMNCSHSRVRSSRRRCISSVLDQWREGSASRIFHAMQAAPKDIRACVVNNSRSQYQEDLLLLPSLLRATGGRSGTFVELGALDGERYSNSWLLETCFGWGGLLIEANPKSFGALQSNGHRQVAKRHSAVCDSPGTVRVTAAGDEVSGQVEQMAARFQSSWKHRNRPSETVAVPCAPLSSLMHAAKMVRADLLSLDVEGAEAIVLRTIDPTAFRYVLVEMDGLRADKDEEVHARLLGAGLEHVAHLRVPNSRVYARPFDRAIASARSARGGGRRGRADDERA